jgi:hypothetical protein
MLHVGCWGSRVTNVREVACFPPPGERDEPEGLAPLLGCALPPQALELRGGHRKLRRCARGGRVPGGRIPHQLLAALSPRGRERSQGNDKTKRYVKGLG